LWRERAAGEVSAGGGNDVVAAIMSSGARGCGNHVVGGLAGDVSRGDREAGEAAVPGLA
jgi:hypothetical protein